MVFTVFSSPFFAFFFSEVKLKMEMDLNMHEKAAK